MDSVWLDQGKWNMIFGRFWLWRKYVRPGHWERWTGNGHGWAKVDHWFDPKPWEPGRHGIYLLTNCRGPWESDGKHLICEQDGKLVRPMSEYPKMLTAEEIPTDGAYR